MTNNRRLLVRVGRYIFDPGKITLIECEYQSSGEDWLVGARVRIEGASSYFHLEPDEWSALEAFLDDWVSREYDPVQYGIRTLGGPAKAEEAQPPDPTPGPGPAAEGSGSGEPRSALALVEDLIRVAQSFRAGGASDERLALCSVHSLGVVQTGLARLKSELLSRQAQGPPASDGPGGGSSATPPNVSAR